MACSLPEKDIITITFRFFWPGRQMRPLLLDSPKLVLPAHLFKQKSAQNFQSFQPGRWDFAGTHGEWSSLFVKGRGTFRLDGSQNFDGRSENPQRIKDELNILRKRRISTTSSYHGNRWSYTKTRTTKKRQNVYIPWCIPNIHRSILCFFSGKNNGWFILMKLLEFVKVERPNAMGIDLHVREIPMDPWDALKENPYGWWSWEMEPFFV